MGNCQIYQQPKDYPYTMVVACAADMVIGSGNSIPWHLPEDLRHFRQLTLGGVVVMGGNTFRSLPAPLSDRCHIVITGGAVPDHPLVRRVATPQQAHQLAQQLAPDWRGTDSLQAIMIIGGGQIYRQWLPYTSRIEMTRIDLQVSGDTFFPQPDTEQWKFTEQPWFRSTNGIRYRFVTWRRYC